MKPAYPDGTTTLPAPDSSLKPPPRPVKPASGTEPQTEMPPTLCHPNYFDHLVSTRVSLMSIFLIPKGFATSKISTGSDWSGSGYGHSATLPRMSSNSFNSGQSTFPTKDSFVRSSETLLIMLKRYRCHDVGGKTATDQKSLSGSDVPPPVPARTNHATENVLRDKQVSVDLF